MTTEIVKVPVADLRVLMDWDDSVRIDAAHLTISGEYLEVRIMRERPIVAPPKEGIPHHGS